MAIEESAAGSELSNSPFFLSVGVLLMLGVTAAHKTAKG